MGNRRLGDLITLNKGAIAFKFLQDVELGKFHTRTESGIIVKEDEDKQMSEPRWGIALSVGDEVTDVKEGDYILITPLRWTTELEIDDYSEKFWITDEKEVMLISDEKPQN